MTSSQTLEDCSAEDSSTFCWRNKRPEQCYRTTTYFTSEIFNLPVFAFADTNLSPSTPMLPFSPLIGAQVPHWQLALASEAVCMQNVSLNPCSWAPPQYMLSWLALVVMHAPACCQPDSCHWPPPPCTCLGWDSTALWAHAESQGHIVACGPRPFPISSHWPASMG